MTKPGIFEATVVSYVVNLISTTAAKCLLRQFSMSGNRSPLALPLACEFIGFDSIALAAVGTITEESV
jgi:hypothetical protein